MNTTFEEALMSGGSVNRPFAEPLSDTLRRHAQAQGYTDLIFNPQTMSWAWHKPDQAVGEDGPIYIRARGI